MSLTGSKNDMKEKIQLEDGAGGKMSDELIRRVRKILSVRGKWKNTGDDGAVYDLGICPHPPRVRKKGTENELVFTTDAFIVDPVFFPGGDIGKIAICGTINDLSVMGARPIGISLSLVIEEGFSWSDLEKIIRSINDISVRTGVPVVTGDTKVTEKGKIDKMAITTAGVGLATDVIPNSGIRPGDAIIVSGDLGEHGVALLSKRFNYKTRIKSDCQPFIKEISSVREYIHAAKDPTRGGLAAVANEMADKSKVRIMLFEPDLPYKKETRALSGLLGIDFFSFPSEGRFVAAVSRKDADKVVKALRRFNKEARIIGQAEKGRGVYLKTGIGSLRRIEVPKGKLIPRIC